MNIKSKDFLLIPNILSILRIFCVPPLFIVLSKPVPPLIISAIILAFIILSDFLDGILARKLNQTSELGKILDPLGDKLIALAAFLGLLVAGRIPVHFAALVIGKDLLIFLGGILIILKVKEVNPSNFFGKWTSTLLAFGIALYSLSPSFATPAWQPGIIASHILLGAGILFLFLSLASYGSIFCATFIKNKVAPKLLFPLFTLFAALYIITCYLPFAKKTVKTMPRNGAYAILHNK